MEASKGGRLDKIEPGYESMDGFSVSLEHLTEAVHALDFDPGNSPPNAPLPTPTRLPTPTASPGGSWWPPVTFGRLFAAEEDEEYFDGEEEEVEEDAAPEMTVMGKGLNPLPRTLRHPWGSFEGLDPP